MQPQETNRKLTVMNPDLLDDEVVSQLANLNMSLNTDAASPAVDQYVFLDERKLT